MCALVTTCSHSIIHRVPSPVCSISYVFEVVCFKFFQKQTTIHVASAWEGSGANSWCPIPSLLLGLIQATSLTRDFLSVQRRWMIIVSGVVSDALEGGDSRNTVGTARSSGVLRRGSCFLPNIREFVGLCTVLRVLYPQ